MGHSLPIHGLSSPSITPLLHVPLHMAPVISEEGHGVILWVGILREGKVWVLVTGERLACAQSTAAYVIM